MPNDRPASDPSAPDDTSEVSATSGALDREGLSALAPAEARRRLLSRLQELAGRLAAGTGPAGQGPVPEPVAADQPLTALGFDSLAAVELQGEVEDTFGVTSDLEALLAGATLEELAEEILAGLDRPPSRRDEEPATTSPGPISRQTSAAAISPGQEAFWFLERFQPEAGPAHLIAGVAEIAPGAEDQETFSPEALSPDALARAVETLAARHGALRSTFVEVDGTPERRERPPEEAAEAVETVLLDPVLLGPAEGGGTSQHSAFEEALFAPMDLARGPLVRVVLEPLGSGDSGDGAAYRFGLAVHHAVADQRSLAVLLQELGALYGASAGPETLLPEPPRPFDAFVARERQRLAGPEGQELLAWWVGQLEGAPTVLDLPTDHPRPGRRRFAATAVKGRLPAPALEALGQLARAAGTTLFAATHGAFTAFLHRLTGQDDLLVGSPTSVRGAGFGRTVGYLVNPVILRSTLAEDGAPTLRSRIDAAAGRVAGALEHRWLPVSRLAEHLQPERDPSRSPLFQVMLAWQGGLGTATRELAPFALGVEGGSLPLGSLSLESSPFEPAGTQVDLTLVAAPVEGGLGLSLEVDRALFDRASAERLLGSLVTFLEAAVAAPDRPLSQLPLLSEAERAELLADGEGAALPAGPEGPEARTLHGLVAARAEAAPDEPALLAQDGTTWSRRELRERSRALAEGLRASGLLGRGGAGSGTEPLVAIAMERTPWMVAAVLAVLEAGAVHLPLDPRQPAERLRTMVEDARPALILTSPGRAEDLAASLEATPGEAPPIFEVDESLAARLRENGQGAPIPSPDPGQLAYVLYTSGSTGRPKGVAIPHASAVAFLGWARETFDPAEWRGTLASTATTFDLSVFELFGPLAWGGAVILAEDALALADHPAADRVTLINTVPSALAELVRTGSLPGAVATVNLAGEPFGPELARAIHDHPPVAAPAGGRRLWNLYGPSESTTYATAALIPEDRVDELLEGAPSIGLPVAGTRARVADARLELVPAGVPGELLLGGAGLARGYFRRPALTAERFVPDPFSADPGERLYRTGDRVRQAPDGPLAFLGRLDHQVKVRGFRIELGEVETALEAHPAVAEAVAAVVGSGSAARLGAFLVLEAAAEDWRQSLLDHLSERLPAYMVPAHLVALDRLPRTATGKVDRKALPLESLGSDGAPAPSSARQREPETPLEAALVEIFGEILERPRVGVEEDFFALGGHSLLATRVVARVRDRFGVELPVRALFETPTAALLAAAVAEALDGQGPEPRLGTAAGAAAGAAAGVTAGAGASLPPIEPRAETAEASPEAATEEAVEPLSFAQRRLWLTDQRDPGNAAYNVPEALAVDGPLDPAALAAAFRAIVRRHEVLRTRFVQRGGEPVQVIDRPEAARVPFAVVDLSGLGAERASVAARKLSTAEAQRPFHLARGPLLRVTLVRLPGAEASPDRPLPHQLLVTLHHIVADGWSMAVLTDEVAAHYRRLTGSGDGSGEGSDDGSKEGPELAPLPIQYADFARWQRRHLTDQALEGQLAFWTERLAGMDTVLELPVDRPRPAAQTFAGAHLAWDIPEALALDLERYARERGATLFMVCLAAYQALLGRLTGQTRFTVGTPIANRQRSELEGLIGFFANTLVLPADLEGTAEGGAPTFDQLVERVRETSLAAYAHQDLPFERLVEALQPVRDPSHSPLFQALFVMHNAPRRGLDLGGLELRSLGVSNRRAKFDLSLSVIEDGDRLRGEIEYNTDLFDGSTARRLRDHYLTLLAGAVARPETRLPRLPLLTQAELAERRHWNDSEVPDARGRRVHEIFEAQAAATPDAPAVSFEGRTLTYAELDEQAGRLAGHLAGRGVGPGSRVGLCVERSLEQAVALLAILKAGAAYVPLDPEYPGERLLYMLDDAGVEILLTQQGLQIFFTQARVATVYLDMGWDLIGEGAPLRGRPSPDDLAYVIYTSGSTGRPKGVMVPHRGLSNHTLWKARTFPLESGSRVFQKTRIGFDAHLWEFFYPWASGGEVVLARPGGHMDMAYLAREIVEADIQAFQFVPSALRIFLEEPIPEPVPEIEPGEEADRERRGVTQAFAGGEALPPDLVRRFHERFPVELANVYGPTEISITCSVWVGRPGDAIDLVPIGRPIANTDLHVFDRHLEPVPVNVPGELMVGGEGLGRGYLGRPGLTADRFIPHPSSPLPGARLYRTGDQVRYWVDGELELVGRLDDQVKIRGFRIEPGEIEAQLLALPEVKDGVILVREDTPGERRLVAYVVAEDSATTGADLRGSLQTSLPDYMVPSAFVFLESLPLNANGKIDRRALPAPAEEAGHPEGGGGDAPRNAFEEVLLEIWKGVLEKDDIGIRDGFFDLGGHSLLATQVNSRITQAFGIELPLEVLFEAPTVEELAARVAEALAGSDHPEAPPLVPMEDGAEAELSFAQQRLWLIEEIEGGGAAYNNPSPLGLSGPLDPALLARAISRVAARHDVLRSRFVNRDGRPVPVEDPPEAVALPVVDLTGLPAAAREAEGERVLQAEAWRPFDLVRGPLLRSLLVRLEGSDASSETSAPDASSPDASSPDHIVLLTLHHIVSDGWSMGRFIRELGALYEAGLAGTAPRLPALPVQYRDYAHWQRRWLQGEVLEAELAHWHERLEGAPPVLELPTDRPRPTVQSYAGDLLPFRLPEEQLARLQDLARQEGATLFMVTLAAFAAVLARWSGQEDFSVGTPVAGRTRVETEDLIGFFVNTLVLRTDLSGNPTFREALGRIRRTALEAQAHQDLPFEKLVEELQPERNLGHSPLFQVMFVVQNLNQDVPTFAGLELEPLRLAGPVSKFDLTVALAEGENGRLGSVEYSTALFDRATIERLVAHFRTVLGGVLENPEERLSRLPLLSAAEREELVGSLSGRRTAPFPLTPETRLPPSEPPSETRLPLSSPLSSPPSSDRELDRETAPLLASQAFAQRASQSPNASALLVGSAQVTYGQLHGEVSRLASSLQHRGIGPEVRVAVSMARSESLVAALLAIWTAGGAYVPIDPGYPEHRRRLMLEDAGPALLLTDLDGDLGGADLPILRWSWGEELDPGKPDTPPALPSAENLAVVIYTSGSTGRPKGVALSHGAIAALLAWAHQAFGSTGLARTAAVTSVSFDLSLFELFAPLTAGTAVVLHDDALALTEAPETAPEAAPSLLNTVPSALGELLSRGAVPASVRTLNLAGEPLTRDLVRRAIEGAEGPSAVWNLYGPSESTTYATAARVDLDGASEPGIGRPIPGTYAQVVGRYLELSPRGSAGELVLGGAGLARGYLGNPSATAERFVPDPFGETPGARLYRTGDRVRLDATGNLHFLGRLDHQVKIRGFRIELAEIEAVLSGHPAVEAAAVTVHEVSPQDRRLVAFVTLGSSAPGSSEDPTARNSAATFPARNSAATFPATAGSWPADLDEQLRGYAAERLPLHMVPSRFLRLDRLPTTPSGKLDRSALPRDLEDSADRSRTAPRTPLEETIAVIWQEVLQVPAVGVQESFFSLGGHSLLASQVIARVQRELEVDLPIRELFARPTVAGLAEAVEEARKTPVKKSALKAAMAAPIPILPRE